MYDLMDKTIHIYTPIIECDSAPHVFPSLMHISWEGCRTTCSVWLTAVTGSLERRWKEWKMEGMGGWKKHIILNVLYVQYMSCTVPEAPCVKDCQTVLVHTVNSVTEKVNFDPQLATITGGTNSKKTFSKSISISMKM